MVTPSDLDYVNSFDSTVSVNSHDSKLTIAGTILRIRTTGCMRTRQSSNEIIKDCSDKGGHRYQPLDRFILREVLDIPDVQVV